MDQARCCGRGKRVDARAEGKVFELDSIHRRCSDQSRALRVDLSIASRFIWGISCQAGRPYDFEAVGSF